ncbi:MAG: hypothetical protein F9K43_10955 [Bauldia sp.]|nr:MAG: hypothetical protein F9K43_10955 [Bauldia sp.]MBZ0228439.1 hypothetical protein [Bauldia sp.]
MQAFAVAAAAEDAVQEARVRIWRQAGNFDATIASPVAWMTTIVRHAAIDIARRPTERISAAAAEVDPQILDRTADPMGSCGGAERRVSSVRRCWITTA